MGDVVAEVVAYYPRLRWITARQQTCMSRPSNVAGMAVIATRKVYALASDAGKSSTILRSIELLEPRCIIATHLVERNNDNESGEL
jgi:hypothetical protein